jgi:hypothetical protein
MHFAESVRAEHHEKEGFFINPFELIALRRVKFSEGQFRGEGKSWAFIKCAPALEVSKRRKV